MADDKERELLGESALTHDTAIMDDDGRILPHGEVGEIVWRGPNVMIEYAQNPEATEEARKFGWHHSGDLGMFDEDGLLQFVDRKKDMVKSGGENVATIKVERLILGDPRVEEVAVLGLPHERWIEAVTAFVVCKEGVKLTEDDVITMCKQELAVFEVPKKVVFVEELPRTSTGKLEKFKIKTQYEDLFSKE
jgi:long-chain acyl-CoA synthetase